MEENNVCDGKTGKQMDETGVRGSGKKNSITHFGCLVIYHIKYVLF